MVGRNKPEEQLVGELADLRRRVSELELAEAEHRRTKKDLAEKTREMIRARAFISALSHVAAHMESSRDPEQMLGTLGAELGKLGLTCLVALLEADSGDLVVRYTSIESSLLTLAEKLVGFNLRGHRISHELEPVKRIFDQGLPFFAPDPISVTTDLLPGIPRALVERAVRAAGVAPGLPVLYFPLIVQERIIGALAMWGQGLRQDDAPILSVFAGQVASSLENAVLFQAEKQRTLELSTVLEATRAVSSTLDLEQVLVLIVEQIITTLGVCGCAIYIYRRDQDADAVITWIERRCDRQSPREKPGAGYALVDLAATRAVLETGQPHTFHVSDPNIDPAQAAYMRKQGIQSLLLLPLAVGGSIIGLVGLDDSTQKRVFTTAEIRLAQALADQAAVAIDNSRLYEMLKQELVERQDAEEALRQAHDRLELRVLERTAELTAANEQLNAEIDERKRVEAALRLRNAELELLNRTGQALNSSLDLDHVLSTVLDEVRYLLDVTACSVWLLDSTTGDIFCQHAAGPRPDIVHGWRLARGEGIVGWIVDHDESVIVPDVLVDDRYFDRVVREAGMTLRSILGVPLRAKEGVVGVLEVVDEKVGRFRPADLTLAESLAASAATAIENARLFEAVALGERQWEATFDAIADGIALVDADLHLVRVNHTLADWLGSTPQELVGHTCYELFDRAAAPPERCLHLLAMQCGQPQVLEADVPGLDGIFLISKYPLDDKAGTAVATVHTFQDITERKRMEQQLLHSERLSAMGKLAASVAHEINNPLQSVIGCLSLAREELSEEDDLEQYLRVAHEEVRRAARTVGQLRDLGRSDSGERAFAQVNSLLEEVLMLSRKQCQENGVELVWKPAHDLPPLPLETDQIKQVFLNLLFNALEAMPQGGRLEVTTSYAGEPPGIGIAFSDTGVGIAPDVLPHVFEPFYSTKRQGMGLGLSVSCGIVEQHGGRIEAESQVASGSTFTIWLPL